MLQINKIHKSFQKGTPDESVLFHDFSLDIPQGQFVAIVGSNGSGKTSLLNILAGNMSLDNGSIIYKDKDISKQKEHQRSRYIGRVFQDPAKGTASSLTVLENLSIAYNKGKSYNLSLGVERKLIPYFRELLAPLGMGLENRLEQKCGSLSGGQRQALALLMSTMCHPEILILDEHTAALDPRSAKTIMELTKELVLQDHFTVLMVSHNLKFALEYGDRLLMMHEGEVILDKSGEAKDALVLDDVLNQFYEISIEKGNSI